MKFRRLPLSFLIGKCRAHAAGGRHQNKLPQRLIHPAQHMALSHIGGGFCRDDIRLGDHSWTVQSSCVNQTNQCIVDICGSDPACRAAAVASEPPATHPDGCLDRNMKRCVAYFGDTYAVATLPHASYECYARPGPPRPPTPPPSPQPPPAPPGPAPPFRLNLEGVGPWSAPVYGAIGETFAQGRDLDGMVHPANTEIFGPFLTAISSKQNAELLAWLGCPAGVGSVPAGVDSSTAEQVIAAQCNLQLPRITENGARIGLLSECGGHGKNFHFHERLSCVGGSRESNRDPATGHSNQVGTALDGSKIFGKYERAGTSEDAIASLDTCGGHFGVTPLDSSGLEYHYHVSDKPPFTIACFGPAGSPARLATVEDCRKLYPQHCGGQPIKLTTARDKQAIEYDLFCPCFDANGSNVDTDWVTASSRSAGARDNTAGEVLRTVFFVLSACGAICCFCCHLSIRRARKR